MRSVSISQLKTLDRCKFRWGQEYLRGVRPKVAPSYLYEGSLLHLALAQYHVMGSFDLEVLASSMKESVEPEVFARCSAVMEEYAAKALPVQGEILAVEWPFQVCVPSPSGTRSNYRLIGRVDMITRTDEGLWVWDHKSSRSFSKSPNLATDAQVSILAYALRCLGAPVTGTVVNRLHLTKTPKFSRYSNVKTTDELACWGLDLYLRCRELPPAKADWRLLPRSPTRECSWDCPFVDLCMFRYLGDFEAEADLLAYEFELCSSRPSQDLSQYCKAIPNGWRRTQKGEHDEGREL